MDDLNDVLSSCMKACGGAKAVAPLLWPEKTPEAAHRLLLDCLNDDRPAHLSNDHMMYVLRLARDRGCHLGMDYIADRLGYSKPVPIAAVDEAAELQRDVVAGLKDATSGIANLTDLVTRLERLQGLINSKSHGLRVA